MLVTTTDYVPYPGATVANYLGFVRGSTVRARNFLRDIIASFRMFVGGEVKEYTKLQADAREQALQRMVEQARAMGADAVICCRLTTALITGGASEILAYGTAVKVTWPESMTGSTSSGPAQQTGP